MSTLTPTHDQQEMMSLLNSAIRDTLTDPGDALVIVRVKQLPDTLGFKLTLYGSSDHHQAGEMLREVAGYLEECADTSAALIPRKDTFS